MRSICVLLALGACPKPPPVASSPAPSVASESAPLDPPSPPPAPVDIAFRWVPGSGCLMSTREVEQLNSEGVITSTLVGEGSGIVTTSVGSDGTWSVEIGDRGGLARHTPMAGRLPVAIETLMLDLEPTLEVSADGRQVLAVHGLADALPENEARLEALAADTGKAGASLWTAALPALLSEEALVDTWRRPWEDGWALAYGRTWVWNEPWQVVSTRTGDTLEMTYAEVVPCKVNEDQPMCVRIEIGIAPAPATVDGFAARSDARFRLGLPPDAQATATVEDRDLVLTGELVIEAPTGFPWRWTTREIETVTFGYAGNRKVIERVRDAETSCDWRVVE